MADYNFYGIPAPDGNRFFAREKNYAVCDTGASTAAKTATLDGFVLATGITVRVKFTYTNTAASPTLNINGTGDKPIMRYGSTAAGTTVKQSWQAGQTVTFVYDGTNWQMADYADRTDTTYSNATTSAAGLMSAEDKTKLNKLGVIEISISSLTAKTYSSTDSIANIGNITSDYVLVNHWFSNPAAVVSDLNITTGAGTVQVAGTISGSTNATFYFALKQ